MMIYTVMTTKIYARVYGVLSSRFFAVIMLIVFVVFICMFIVEKTRM